MKPVKNTVSEEHILFAGWYRAPLSDEAYRASNSRLWDNWEPRYTDTSVLYNIYNRPMPSYTYRWWPATGDSTNSD